MEEDFKEAKASPEENDDGGKLTPEEEKFLAMLDEDRPAPLEDIDSSDDRENNSAEPPEPPRRMFLKILLYTLSAFLACRSVAENTEDSSKVASTPSIFSVDSVISALVGKFPFQTEFAENEHLVKFLYFALETNNSRYAIGYEYHGLVVVCRYGDNY